MEFDINCIRNILLQAENGSFSIQETYNNFEVDVDDFFSGKVEHKNLIPSLKFLSSYDLEKLNVHISLAKEFGLIETNFLNPLVKSLTPDGYSFLSDIKNDNVWNEIIKISTELGLSSFESIKEITKNFTSKLIINYFDS